MSPRQNSPSKMEDLPDLTAAGYKFVKGAPQPPPILQPKFTFADLKAAIPAHCFQRSMAKSFSYLAWDVIVCSVLFYGAYNVLELMPLPFVVKVIGYLAYWFVQGSYMTGLWVIAHECGHQGFSESGLVNDVVGAIFHSILFTPYHSWKITHRIHHANTGSCENDEVYVPITHAEVQPTWSETLEDSPIYNLFKIIQMLILGWMPGYLCLNSWGPKKYNDVAKNHFNPNSSFYLPKERYLVILSNIECFAALSVLGYFIYTYGFWLVFKLYIVPYMVVNYYVVLITYLHHTDTFIPHLREGEWNWLHGNLCTVDRSFGKWIDSVIHRVADTHVCHHLFTKIPHYHAAEATEAMKPILGEYYLNDPTPIFIGKFIFGYEDLQVVILSHFSSMAIHQTL